MIINIERKKFIYLVLFILWIYPHVFGHEMPKLEIDFAPKTEEFLKTYSQMIPPMMKSPEDVKIELKKRYNEAWAADKSKWPECMRQVFENLKKYDKITIYFKIEGTYQWPFYQGDTDADGYVDIGYFMRILNVFAPKSHVTQQKIDKLKLDKSRINPKMQFDSSGGFLHELIHMALQRNEIFKEVYHNGVLVDSWQDETRPEDCTTLAIANAIRYYDLKGENSKKNVPDDCTCKNKPVGSKPGSGLGASDMYSPGNDHGDECFSYAQDEGISCLAPLFNFV